VPACLPACCRLAFSYEVLTPAALNFFVSYADGAVESLWSIDQYFEFVLVLMLSTGLSFQVRTRRQAAAIGCWVRWNRGVWPSVCVLLCAQGQTGCLPAL
jgi:hypothetical protein